MTHPVQSFKRQGQMNKRKGAGTGIGANAIDMAEGAYTSELFAIANAAAGTDVAVITAVAGARIRVLSYSVSGAAGGVSTTTFNTKPAGAGSAISPLISLPTNGFAHEADENGLFQTAVGEGLTVTVATNTVGIRVTYMLCD